MRYITKIHRVEAVKYDGLNKAEIEALVSDQLENFVYLLDNGNLLVRDGTVHIGDWVVLDGIAKILSHGQFMELYEEAIGEEYIERESEMKTIYISGPMKNMADGNMPAFDEAEKQLKQLGFDVLNPHKICEELNIRFFEIGKIPTYEDYLKEDIIQMLSKCDIVLVLPGWRGSEGSKCEIANAIACGLDVVFDISDVQ